MELRDLEYFLACLTEGHLTRAAERLHVAQPTLSHAVARLETEVGARLFDRPAKGRPGLRPTSEGRLLAERARRALFEVESFRDDLDELRGLLRGEVRIGSMQTLNSTLLPRPLARFALDHPGVKVTLHTYAAEQIPAALREGHIDLGLIAGAPKSAFGELAHKRVLVEELVLIVRQDDPMACMPAVPLSALADRQFVMVLPGTFTSQLILSSCAKAGFSPKTLIQLESGEAIREVVREGLGLTILPARYHNPRDPSLRAVRLIRPTPRREVHVTWSDKGPLSAAARAFLVTLEDKVVLHRRSPEKAGPDPLLVRDRNTHRQSGTSARPRVSDGLKPTTL